MSYRKENYGKDGKMQREKAKELKTDELKS